MFLFGVHQPLGQLSDTMFHAFSHTRLFVTVSLAVMVFSVPLTWLMLAGTDAAIPGLGLRALGLALKIIGLHIISVNIMRWHIAKIVKTPFDCGFQFALLALSLAAGGAATVVGSWLGQALGAPQLLFFTFSFGIYLACGTAAVR